MSQTQISQASISYCYLLSLLFVLVLGSLNMGWNCSVFGPFIELFGILYGWNKVVWSSIVTTMVPLGALFSSTMSGRIMSFGRRQALFAGGVLSIIGTIFISGIQSPSVDSPTSGIIFLCIGRFLLGLATGIYSTVVPAFINEISPLRYTGTFGSFHQVFVCLGFIATYLCGLSVSTEGTEVSKNNTLNWRLTMGVPGMLGLIQSLFLLFVYRIDTPVYYISIDEQASAESALKALYTDEKDVIDTLELLKNSNKKAGDSSDTSLLFKKYSKTLWIGIAIAAMQQLSGICVIMFYAPTIFQKQGSIGQILSIITMVINSTFVLVSFYTADMLGRRILLIAGCIGCGLGFLICFVASFGEATVNYIFFDLGVYLFVAVFEITHGPISWIYIAEIMFPVWMGYIIGACWIFTILVSISTPFLIEGIGNYTFLVFVILMALGTIFCILFIKETKGKTSEECKEQYADNSPNESQNKTSV